MAKPELTTIGWREWVGLPDLGVGALKAKVDTGARTSSLHAVDLHYFRRRGRDWVSFRIHPHQRDTDRSVIGEAELVDDRAVRSSSGEAQRRPVILTTLVIGAVRTEIEVTLTNRALMGFRMLLGREALRQRFAVDPGASFLVGAPPRRRARPAARG